MITEAYRSRRQSGEQLLCVYVWVCVCVGGCINWPENVGRLPLATGLQAGQEGTTPRHCAMATKYASDGIVSPIAVLPYYRMALPAAHMAKVSDYIQSML